MFCVTLNDSHYNKIRELGYTPVGLGKNISNNFFQRDDTGNNISTKNPYYGEYTFHYWLWKNEIKKLKEKKWIGFCQYRKYWSLKINKIETKNFNELKQNVLRDIPEDFDDYDTILGNSMYINKFKLSKLLKKNFLKIIKNPSLIFNEKKRNIKFHFDTMHGDGNLDKAISLLDKSDRADFNYFVNSEVSFNPHNMFICKSSVILEKYYNSIFPWLKRCEKEFGFELEGYGLKRIYGFLAERFMSFWFKKYTKFTTMPIIFKDITYLN